MMTSILALLAALIPFGIWLYKKRAAQKTDPIEKHRERTSQIDSAIAERDSAAAGADSARDLDELERLQIADAARRGDSGGSNGNFSHSGPNRHGEQ